MSITPRLRTARAPKAARTSHLLSVLPLEDRTVPAGSSGTHLVPDGGGLDTQPASYSFSQPAGFLTGPQAGDRDAVARATLAAYAGQAGLTAADIATAGVSDSYASLDQSHVYFRQQLNGLPVINATAGVHLMADGRAVMVNVAFVPDVAATPAVPVVVSPVDAVSRAAAAFGYALSTPPTVLRVEGGPRQTVVVSEAEFSDQEIRVQRAYVNTARGVRPVWELVARTPDGDHWFDAAVDAQDGAVEYYADWVDHFDTYNVVPGQNESPQDGGLAVLVNPADPVASPYGWHDTNGAAGAEFNDTRGNNVYAQEDRDANNSGGTRPSGGTDRVFNFPFLPTQDPTAYLDLLTTNLFYANNYIHDVTYKYGFDEVSGNFQQKNYTGLGLGNDGVQADAMDGSGTDNANFATPPDGTPGRMQMYRFTITSPNRDSDIDNGIMFHEYGHGISNRLTGGPANANALNALQSGGMGEGWSDFWALMLTQKPGDQANDRQALGTYVLGQPQATGNGIRGAPYDSTGAPYSFDLSVNTMTFAQYGNGATGTEVHNTGARWASALWDLNWLLINKYGYDQDLTTGYAAGGGPASAGNKLAMRLVIDGMKLQAANPTFIQARDAILSADVALTGGVNQREIWTAFARRGLGFGASTATANSSTLTSSFAMPPVAAAAPAVIAQSPTASTGTAPASLTLTFSEAMNTGSFSVAADVAGFTGPGGTNLLSAITGFAWTTSTTLRIDFTAQTAQGRYTLVVGPNVTAADNGAAMDQDLDGTAGEATQDRYTANFQYDATALTVTAITPTTGGTAPVSTTTIDVTFSEPILASSLSASDLSLSLGTVTGVSLLSATQAQFTVSGFSTSIGEANVYLSLKYGAVTDVNGFASQAFNSSFSLDYLGVFFPAPLAAAAPLGSLVYDGTFPYSTQIGSVGDIDTFGIVTDGGQRLTAIVTPAAGLALTLAITNSSGTTVATTTGAAGVPVTITAPVNADIYSVGVAGAGGTTGTYSVRLLLNAVGEGEQYGAGGNDTVATAQPLGPLFTTPAAGVDVVSVLGSAGAASAETEANGTTGTANDLSSTLGPVASSVYQLGWTGAITTSDVDYVNLGALQAGDVLTVTMSGSTSGISGGIGDAYLELYLPGNTLVAFSDDDGPGLEPIVYRYTVTTAGTYYVAARGYGSTDTGSYRVGVRLENAGTAPTTGGTFTAEAESNGSIATANNASGAWAQVQTQSRVTGTITAGDSDFFRYTLTAGDRLTVQAAGGGTFYPAVALLNSAGTVLQTYSDANGGAGQEAGLYGYVIPTTGTYYVRVTAAAGTGSYTLDLLQSGTAPPAATKVPDFYAVTLANGQLLSAGLTGSANTLLQITDAAGTVLATGTAAANYTLSAQYAAAAAGTYYVRVADTFPTAYQLTVARGAVLEREANNTTGTAQTLIAGVAALGGLTAADDDWYAVTLPTAGLTLRAGTATPGDATGEFVNLLDPTIEVYNPAGTLIGTDTNSAGDGRNASITLAALAAGTYRVRVRAAGGTTGEYLLTAELISNQSPTGVSAGGPYTVAEGGTLTLTGTATDPEGDALTYSWDVNGDGTYGDATGASPTLSAAQLTALGLGDGPFTATVRVRATDGNSSPVASAGTPLTVTNVAPAGGTAGNSGPTPEGSGTPITVTVSGVTDPSAADTAAGFRYSYDFDNDGTFDLVNVTTSTAAVPAGLLADGPTTRTVRIAVYDKDGGSTELTTTIAVTGVAPTGTLTGSTAAEGSAGSVTVAGVTDPSAADTAAGFRYSYDFDNDGTFDLGGTSYATAVTTATVAVPASYLPDGPGTRVVRVRIFDKDGNASDTTGTVTVTNVAPTSTLAGATAAEGGTADVAFGPVTDPSAADAAAGFRYAYDFDDDGTFDLGGSTYATAVTAATAAVPAALLLDSGVRTVRARVYDRDGGFTEYTADVTVTNVAPTASFAGGTAVEGSAGTVTFSAASDPSAADAAAGFRYSFDFDNDGTFDLGDGTYAGGVATAAVSVPASYLTDGPFGRVVRGRIYDQDGGFTEYTATVTVTNADPAATLANGGPVAEGSAATVTTTATDAAGDQPTLRYSYDFGNDGTFDLGGTTYATAVTAATATVPAAESGSLPVRVRVFDKDGGFADAVTTITVTNVAPTASFTAGGSVVEGSAGSVAFGPVTDPSAGDAAAGFRYSYDFDNDGTFDLVNVTSGSATVPASYLTDGPSGRVVRAQVYDRDGGFTEYTTTISVMNADPTAALANGGPVAEGQSATVTATAQDAAGDQPTLRYAYDFGNDGTFDLGGTTYATAVTAATATVPAAESGSLPVRVRVFDKDGGFADAVTTITVTNVAPTAVLSNSGPVAEGAGGSVTFTGATDPSPADAAAGFRYAYDFDNDGTFDLGGSTYATAVTAATATVPASLLSDSGVRTVRARVYDRNSGFTEYTTSVTVTNMAPTATFVGGTAVEGSAGSVSFTGATDPSLADVAAGFRYSFDFDNDGTFEVTTSTAATAVVPAGYLPNGPAVRTVRGRVADQDGGFTDYTTTIAVTNAAPTATFAGGGSVVEGASGSVAFSAVADASADDVAAVRYAFDFDNDGTFDLGDGTYAGGVTTATAAVPANYLADGPSDRVVRGRVIDPDGGFTDYTATITVTNAAPTTTFAADGPVTLGQPTVVRFGTVADTAADAAAGFTYRFDFLAGGDTTTVTGTDPVATFTFLNPGTYTVRGRVTDRDGGFADYTTTATVTTVAPTATFTGATTAEGGAAAVSFANATHPSPNAVAAGFRYSYDFDNDGTFDLGDGTFAGGVAAATADVPAGLLLDSGTRTVRGRVAEVNGGFADLTAAVGVADAPPTATFTPPAGPIRAGTAFVVSLAASSDPSPADVAAGLRYSFDLDGDGTFDVVDSPSATASVSLLPGTYTLTGRVTDQDGLSGDTTLLVTVPPSPPAPVAVKDHGIAVGTDAGGAARAVLTRGDGTVLFDGVVFGPGFSGGVRVASGDVDGDGVPDLIVGTGPGVATQVRVISGATRTVIFELQPFEAAFTGGVYVAAGDVDGDGRDEIAVSPDEGGGPRVRVFTGGAFTLLTDYFGIDDPTFRGGARPAFGDVSGDGRADLLVAAGFGGGPRVSVWDGASLGTPAQRTLFNDFFLFEQTLRNGVFITAGDIDGDGFAEVIAGGGPGGGPRVFAFSGRGLMAGQPVPAANFFAGDPANRGGVRLAAADFDGDGRADIVAGSGAGAGSRVTRYSGATIAADGQPPAVADADAFPGLTDGVFVG